MKQTVLAPIIALALAGNGAPLHGQTLAIGTLAIGAGAPATSIDPHFYNASPNNSVAMHLFDTLVTRDAFARTGPGLAAGWEASADGLAWTFRLRPGVQWHDGHPFTAEDVAFTLARAPAVPNSPGGFGGFLAAVREVEVVDPLTIRIRTHAPSPLMPASLASVAIIARHAAEGAATEDFNVGRAAIGTGPYRFISYTPGDRVVMERNPAYWGPAPAWQGVNYRFITNDGARTAALLAGDVDLIDQVPSADLARLKANQRLRLSEITGLRMIYLGLDYRAENPPGITAATGGPIGPNPLRDVRVRRALSAAINREAIADRIMEGTATPTGQWLPKGAYSHAESVAVPEFDPDGARRLLAEAGYPQGFRITLFAPNDRYPNDAKTAQAIAGMWTRIGLPTSVDALPWTTFSPRSARQEFGVRLIGWGSVTGEASYTLVNVIGTFSRERRWGAVNAGRYSNAALDALTAEAIATIDDGAREAALVKAVALAMEDVALIPIMQLVNAWATKDTLVHEPRMDERTLAMSVRPAPMR
jgi:peptide/nickel transport system substrate-binding protein